MAIQAYVQGEDFKKLIDDKLINANSIKHVMKRKGIIPICNNAEDLSNLVYRIFFGSDTMTKIHQVMNFEQNNLKSTMVVINPKSNQSKSDFLGTLSDEFVKLQRLPESKYTLKNIRSDGTSITLQYIYDKPQKGMVSLADTKTVTLDVSITSVDDGQYKVSIRHDGVSESKQFITLLDNMVKVEEGEQVFSLRRVTLNSLLKTNKVDFFDKFGAVVHKEWALVDVTNVTVNKSEASIDEDSDDENSNEIDENEPSGKLTGISSAILNGGGLRNNDFVKECMAQGFIFSSMRYRFRHKTLPITIEIDVTFKQVDLKINITKTFQTGDDGIDYKTPLPTNDQSEYIDYFQNIAYSIYCELIEKQRIEVIKLGR